MSSAWHTQAFCLGSFLCLVLCVCVCVCGTCVILCNVMEPIVYESERVSACV